MKKSQFIEELEARIEVLFTAKTEVSRDYLKVERQYNDMVDKLVAARKSRDDIERKYHYYVEVLSAESKGK